ncbi:MAG: creatininase family protein [Herpetosiphonaceae bacterium]|nr:creatininase family protein [Herpetosiphonaceae bacterium]
MHLLLEELTRVEARAQAPETLLILPVGATEQHGPHLPVGVDAYTVTHIAREAATALQGQLPVLVAPTLPFGSSHHHLPFGGTMSLSTETYYRVLMDLIESCIVSGFRRIFVLNGHGGNNELIQLAVRDLALKHPVQLAAASYWTIAWNALIAAEAHLHGGLPGHSGIFETSLMLALRPELVREPRPHRDAPEGTAPQGLMPYRAELHGSWQRIDGYTDSPDQANAKLGEHYLAVIVQAVAQALTEFCELAQGSDVP